MRVPGILQIGTPEQVYSHPKILFVAQLVGEMNLMRGQVIGAKQRGPPIGKLQSTVPTSCKIGREVMLAIRPEHVRLGDQPVGYSRTVKAKIVRKNYLGDAALYEVDVGGLVLKIKVPGGSHLAVKQEAALVLPRVHWHIRPVK